MRACLDNNITAQRFLRAICSTYFLLSWVILAALSFVFIDKSLALFVHHHLNHLVDNIATDFTFLGYSGKYIIVFAIMFLAGRFVVKKPTLAKAGLLLLLAVIVPGLFCDILKMLLGRARPDMLYQHGMYGFYFLQIHARLWSFPSGHSTTIAGVMVALSLLLPRFWWAFISVAVIVALSRIIVAAHYLSDVMIGLYLGTVGTVWVYSFLQRDYKWIAKLCGADVVSELPSHSRF